MQDKTQTLEILLAAKKALEQIDNGKLYTSGYVVDRFETASNLSPTDGLIGNMRDVLRKKASSQSFFTQKEIGEIYDRMLGMAGGSTNFRDELGDLLPNSRQLAEPVKTASMLRLDSGRENLKTSQGDTELSNAFSVLFGLGKESSFSSYKGNEDNSVQKVVVSQLASIGMTPENVEVVGGNDHFSLCSAFYRTASHRRVAIQLPVQTSGGIARPPEKFISGDDLVDLNRRNLYVAVKEAEHNKKFAGVSKFAAQRDNSKQINYEKAVVPKSLEKFADLENSLVAAVSKYKSGEVASAINLVSKELSSLGASSPQVKVASSNSKELVLDAHVPTEIGNVVLHIPVEVHNGRPILPSKFAVDAGPESVKVYDFSQEGMDSFRRNTKPESHAYTVSRRTGSLGSMSYHQLLDRIISGVSNKDYRAAEDALSTIQERFGGEQFKSALDYFTRLIKHSSDQSETERSKLVKAAVSSGELIKFPTTLEWYSPKLGLPLSKIAFDDKGRMIPARKKAQANNLANETLISNSKIVLT
jgi:hypothetical protein